MMPSYYIPGYRKYKIANIGKIYRSKLNERNLKHFFRTATSAIEYAERVKNRLLKWREIAMNEKTA